MKQVKQYYILYIVQYCIYFHYLWLLQYLYIHFHLLFYSGVETTLVESGVCLKVPFNRVTIKPVDTTGDVVGKGIEAVDFAGVS